MDRIFVFIGFCCLIQYCYCATGDLRLARNGNKHSGVLQVRGADGSWGTICNDTEWTSANTDVACKQLGYLGGAGTVLDELEEDAPILMRGINCTGDEWQLRDCIHMTATGDCGHADDISIACIPPGVVSCVATQDDAPPLTSKVMTMPLIEPGVCLQHCRKYGFEFASVDDLDRCACGNEDTSGEGEPFEECRTVPCPGDIGEFCGAAGLAVVYNVHAGNCGGRISGKEGAVTSPEYPLPYEGGLTCTWKLELQSPTTKLSFQGVSLAEGDQIKVTFPDEDVVIPHSVESFMKSTSAKMVTVVFTSLNGSVGGDGFFLHFQDDTQCDIPDVLNGSLVTDPSVIYRPGDKVRMRCDSNLIYSNETVVCKLDGMWFPEPSCDKYVPGLSMEFIRTILIMVIVGLVALGILFALTACMLGCIKANEKRLSGYQGITTEIVEAPQVDSIQEERYTPLTKDDIKVQLDDEEEEGEMDNNANEQQQVSPVAEEDLDDEEIVDEEGSDAAAAGDDTVEADETLA